jgi:hypothetical protein
MTSNDERTERELDEIQELMGAQVERDEAVFPVESVGTLGEMTDTRIYEGDLEARPPDSDQPDEPLVENLDFLEALELREDETDNPDEAAEEGIPWVPPTDPPVVGATDDGELEIGAGFGTTALDEPFDADHHDRSVTSDDEVTERVREALRADSLASRYADELAIETDGTTVIVEGEVDDLDDEEQIVAVVSEVSGLTRLVNRIRVRAIE